MGCCSRGKRKISSADTINEKDIRIDGLGDTHHPDRRQCRNSFCLLLFGLFLGFSVILNLYIVYKGDFRRINGGWDSNCDICGIKNERNGVPGSGQDKSTTPYLIYIPYDPRSRFLTELDELSDQYFYKECTQSCPPEYKAILRRCFPIQKNISSATDFYMKLGMQDFYEEVKEDINTSSDQILWMCLIALGTALFIGILLRFIVSFIVWLVLFGVSIISILGTISLWLYYSMRRADISLFSSDWDRSKLNYLLTISIFSTIFTLIILFVIFGLRKHISLAVGIFNEAGKAVSAMPFLLIQPIYTFAILASLYFGWFYIALLIESAGDPQIYYLDEVSPPRCRLVKNELIRIARWWNLFGLIWLTQFAIDCQHFIVAASVSAWFFTRDKKKLRKTPVIWSVNILLSYHLGSIAFGSLIITTVKVIRIFLNFLQKRLKNKGEYCQGLLKCFRCFTLCLEKALIFLNKNAYIEMAIYGKGFCSSAKRAFNILVSNVLRVAFVSSTSTFILFLGKAIVVANTLFFGFQMLKDQESLNYLAVPLVIGGLMSYFIAHCFISIYEMAIDTIFIAFCEDCAMNDGIKNPYFMSRGLMEFVKKNNRAIIANNLPVGEATKKCIKTVQRMS